jgi:hypothetical protein
VRFIQVGGLDRARRRQIDDLKEQEQRLRQAQMARPTAPGGDVTFDATWSAADLKTLMDHLLR